MLKCVHFKTKLDKTSQTELIRVNTPNFDLASTSINSIKLWARYRPKTNLFKL